MKRRILSAALMLCLLLSSQSAAYAYQEEPLLQENVFTEESLSGVARDNTTPVPSEVYKAMTALKDQEAYKEGAPWTNDVPYSGSRWYSWKGGALEGKNIAAVGCVAFAFILSDAAFDSLPARMYAPGGFSFEDIKVGDILRLNTDTHTVIVLEVSDTGVVVAEGNYSGVVHWGRTISKEVVMKDASHYITRYPERYVSPDDQEGNESVAGGDLDGGLTWNLTKAGTLTISGNGAMPDFSSAGEQPWSNNSSQIKKIIIGNGVTSIGFCAFWNCSVLSVQIPSSVTVIGNNAFYGSSIISVTIPSSVKTVGDSAFRGCRNLSSVTFSNGLETIGQNAFRACTSLLSIALPASIGKVGDSAFFECIAMSRVTFAPGSKQVKLSDNLFTRCYALMSETLPSSIDRIGKGMFMNCGRLAGVEIPKGAESIGERAFASCAGMTAVVIPDSVTLIETAAFSACPLADIYFTGTEAQWSRINVGDTSAVSNATIHYNCTPGMNPAPGTGNDINNSNNAGSPGSGNNPGNSGSSGNVSNPGNSSNSGNSSSPGNGSNSGSGVSQTSKRTSLAKGKTFTKSKVTYKVTKVGKEVELIKSKSTAKKITINTVTGTDGVKYKVTSIGTRAMRNNKRITGLTIGANVKKIGKNAFDGCKKLKKVTVKSKKLSSVGKKSFKNTKSSLKVKVPSRQLKKYKKLFKKAGLKTRQIIK